MISIIDYGIGNLRSVHKALELAGAAARIVRDPDQVRASDKIILPGVGAFPDAIATLRESGMADAIIDFAAAGKPFLGICLGMQLLVDEGFEDGHHAGLGIIAGKCVRFTVDEPPHRLKVPHMGWNALEFAAGGPLLAHLPQGAYMYFVHSYHVVPADTGAIAARADYGGKFAAALWQGNVMATQFHPEKSQAAGRVVLENFARL